MLLSAVAGGRLPAYISYSHVLWLLYIVRNKHKAPTSPSQVYWCKNEKTSFEHAIFAYTHNQQKGEMIESPSVF